jgi:CelD/BcsL family acetyltransferase involved in cellulose biosynthesis
MLATARQAEQGEAAVTVTSAEGIAGLAEDWDALCDRLDASPAMRPGWLSAWWDSFGSGGWEILVARRGHQLTGVMPLLRRGRRLASPTNWHSPEWEPVAEDRATEAALTEEMLARASGQVDLGFLRDDHPALSRMAEAAEHDGRRVVVRVLERSPFVRLEGSWEEFERRLPSKRRSDLRRRIRRLRELGSYRLECDDGSERTAELVHEGLEIEAIGWEGRNGTPIAARRDTKRFYEQIAHWAAEKGCLRLFFLRLDGEPVAFAYCLVHAGSLFVLKIGFDPSYARFAPGLLLTREMLAYAFASDMHTYEFLGRAEPYKLIWTEECRDRVRLQAFPRDMAGLAGYLAWTRGRRMAKWALRKQEEAPLATPR